MCTDVAIMEAGRLLASGTAASDPRTARHGAADRRCASPTAPAETFTVADDDEQAALLRRLVARRASAASRVRRGALRPRAAVHVHHGRDRAVSAVTVNPVIGRELTERLRGFRAFVAISIFVLGAGA